MTDLPSGYKFTFTKLAQARTVRRGEFVTIPDQVIDDQARFDGKRFPVVREDNKKAYAVLLGAEYALGTKNQGYPVVKVVGGHDKRDTGGPRGRPGGKREGAGRPPIDPKMVKVPVGYKLPRWLVDWLREQNVPAAQLIEDALRRRHKLKPPAKGEA